ncbi:transposase [Phenylobacterium sp.]|uniref:RNA-guided endonuclease InsQ/TnpB family protein n=1 Tax=Phenylobacterium sp. TaxID=1871053 RepID=UPI001988DF98|nr:transposase [Phenylobacterium sp.]MBC7168762.1 IS200/IS605 family element transposase accessory protein TnpB [Phenylobacterium sp.]
MNRAVVFRLEPTAAQRGVLERYAGAARYVYNCALEQQQTWGRRHPITRFSQDRELTACRREIEWLREPPREILASALADLSAAYEAFFKRRGAYPNFRRKGHDDRFRYTHGEDIRFERLNRNRGRVRLPKVGWLKLRGYRELPGDIRGATVRQRGQHWYVSILLRQERPATLDAACDRSIGIDRGVAVFAATSDGVLHGAPSHFAKIQKRLGNAQRQLARRKRGSANYKKTRARIARLHMRAADARKDYLHKLSTDIAKSHGFVALEDLKIGNMTRSAAGTVEAPGKNVRQKAGLNRSILDKGWGMFATFLRYKLEERGGELIMVEPAYTSQTCAACGVISRESRKSQSVFECVACGHADNADINAARNIIRAGHARRACGSSQTTGRKQEPHQEATDVAA